MPSSARVVNAKMHALLKRLCPSHIQAEAEVTRAFSSLYPLSYCSFHTANGDPVANTPRLAFQTLSNIPHLLPSQDHPRAAIGDQHQSQEPLDASSSTYEQCRNTSRRAQTNLRHTSFIFSCYEAALASPVFLIWLKINPERVYF